MNAKKDEAERELQYSNPLKLRARLVTSRACHGARICMCRVWKSSDVWRSETTVTQPAHLPTYYSPSFAPRNSPDTTLPQSIFFHLQLWYFSLNCEELSL